MHKKMAFIMLVSTTLISHGMENTNPNIIFNPTKTPIRSIPKIVKTINTTGELPVDVWHTFFEAKKNKSDAQLLNKALTEAKEEFNRKHNKIAAQRKLDANRLSSLKELIKMYNSIKS